MFQPGMSQVPVVKEKPKESNLTREDAESKMFLKTQIKQEPLDISEVSADGSNSIIVEIEKEDNNLKEKHWMDSNDEALTTVSAVHKVSNLKKKLFF